MGRRRQNGEQSQFLSILSSDFNGLLVDIPLWVRRAISRRLERRGKLVLVSAVCPDYERQNGRFTYRSVGSSVPFIAAQHLQIASELCGALEGAGIEVEYHITLADTEFDLPHVMEQMSGGNSDQFLQQCQQSCDQLIVEAKRVGLPLVSCGRFTVVFQQWFPEYHRALAIIEEEAEKDPTTRTDLIAGATGRRRLYEAMAAVKVDDDYCQHMVKRQWAQYMAWGSCAEEVFGSDLVMMNHTTTNLGRVNHPVFRQGRERIPILQLRMSTMPE